MFLTNIVAKISPSTSIQDTSWALSVSLDMFTKQSCWNDSLNWKGCSLENDFFQTNSTKNSTFLNPSSLLLSHNITKERTRFNLCSSFSRCWHLWTTILSSSFLASHLIVEVSVNPEKGSALHDAAFGKKLYPEEAVWQNHHCWPGIHRRSWQV